MGRCCRCCRCFFVVVAIAAACGCGSSPPPASTTTGNSAGRGDQSLPVTIHALGGAPEGAVLIVTKAHAVSVDGTKVSDVTDAAVATTPTTPSKKPTTTAPTQPKEQRIDGLFRALHARAEESKKAHPGETASGRASFTFERDDPASIVKSVVGTAAHAGYPYAALLVRLAPPNEGAVGPGYLNLDVRIDGDPSKSNAPAERERELQVNLSARGVVLLKWTEHGKALADVVASDVQMAKLTSDIGRGWNERGLHRDPTDKRFDQAILHVDNDTPYTLLIVTLDALHATKRKLAVAGKEELVPAINTISLSIDLD